MLPSSPPTGFARLSPVEARLVLLGVAGAAVFFVVVAASPQAIVNPGRPAGRGVGDPALYRAEAERVHRGESYYDVLAAELPTRGYPTRSVFNWRTPLPVWMIGRLPAVSLGKPLLGLLGLALLVVAFETVARDGSVRRAIGAACLLTGPLLLAAQDDHFLMPVFWSGTLIALSVCAYGLNRPMAGAALGLAALYFRELALPYCLLMGAIALGNRRRGELLAWTLGLSAWLVFFAWHCLEVLPRIGPDAIAHEHGWLRLAGAPFVLATAQMNAYLMVVPQWVAALYFVAAMLGLAGWPTPLGQRAGLATCLFVAAFAAVGQPFNQYWGALVAPLLCLGVARCPASLGDLWRAARARLPSPASGRGKPFGMTP
jgi:hypothetical protein